MVVITEAEVLGVIAQQDAVNKVVERIGFVEVLRGLAVRAETNARFARSASDSEAWRDIKRRMKRNADRVDGMVEVRP